MEQRLRKSYPRELVVKYLGVTGVVGLLLVALPVTEVFSRFRSFHGPLILTIGLLAMAGIALYGFFRDSSQVRIAATIASITWLIGSLISFIPIAQYFVSSHRVWWAIASVLVLVISGLTIIFGGFSERWWARTLGIALGCGGIASAVLIVIHALCTTSFNAFPRELLWLAMISVAPCALVVFTLSERVPRVSSSTHDLRLTAIMSGTILNATIAASMFAHVLLRWSPALDRILFAAVGAILVTSVVLLVRRKTIGLLFAMIGSLGAVVLAVLFGSNHIINLPSFGLYELDRSLFGFLYLPSIASALLCVVPMACPIVRFFKGPIPE